MFALAISSGFIYPHVVALELTIRHMEIASTSTVQQINAQINYTILVHGRIDTPPNTQQLVALI